MLERHAPGTFILHYEAAKFLRQPPGYVGGDELLFLPVIYVRDLLRIILSWQFLPYQQTGRPEYVVSSSYFVILPRLCSPLKGPGWEANSRGRPVFGSSDLCTSTLVAWTRSGEDMK